MLLNKLDKEKILDNIVVDKHQIGKTIHLNWKAGKLSYILDVKSIWTKAQKEYLDDRFGKIESRLDNVEARLDKVEVRLDKIESRLDVLEKDVAELKVEVKKINEKIDLIFQTLQIITKQLNDIQNTKHD